MKTIKKIRQIGGTEIPTYLFELGEEQEVMLASKKIVYKFLRGGIVPSIGMNVISLAPSDEHGTYLDFMPLFQEQGFNTFQSYFTHIGWTYIDGE